MDPEAPATPEPVEPVSPSPEPKGLDVEATVADIAESLHLSEAPEPEEPTEPEEKSAAPEPKPVGAPEGTPPGPPAGTPPPSDDTPATWRKEAKEAWAALPPVVKEEVAKREADIQRYVQDTSVAVKVATGFEKIIEPYAPLFQQYGVNPWDHIPKLLQAHHTLLFGAPEQKQGMFRQLAKDAGIDLAALAAGNGAAAETPYLAEMRALQAEIAQLKGGVNQVTETVKEARLNELTQSVLAFAQDVEAHPWFDEVADDIKQLIDAKAVKTLDEAYQTAVMRNPSTRQKLLEKELAARRALEEPKEEKHVAQAMKAKGGMVKSAGKGRAPAGPETVDETLRKTLDKIHNRDAH